MLASLPLEDRQTSKCDLRVRRVTQKVVVYKGVDYENSNENQRENYLHIL
jgi:hypothetical protein